MADRIVNIKLQADATGMVQGLGRARDAAGELNAKVKESAKSQRQEWATVGTGLTAVGVAITGVGVAALATGIQYNTLQQTSRAAMTSLLGSAQAANAQMDKLDDFARNSPFSKATFITAQQQMLAFGIEAKKVIPYLDGVQNAVAAAGGSNADIEGIVATMSKIQSSSKITATDLMEFGNRGVNAADLIGSQMGKTGAQIRTDITAGTLGAEQALDALTAGMSQKFSGAADNVKNTFAGSMDRVKAAWRDFSAELAKPLVDPNGGGALVDLLNWTADAMRNFEKLPEPIKSVISALAGLAGVGALAAGTAMLAIPQWVAFTTALVDLGLTAGVAKAGLMSTLRFLTGPWGVALMAAAATVAVFNARMEESKASAQELEIGIKQGASAFQVMQEQADKGLNVRGIFDMASSVENLGDVLDETTGYANNFTRWLFQDFDDRSAIENIRELGGVLASMSAEDLPRAQKEFANFAETAGLSASQVKKAFNEMPEFKSALLDAAEAAGMATDDTTLLKLALGELSPPAESSANSLEKIQGAAVDTTEAISDLADEILNFGSAQIDADRASLDFEEQLSKLNERLNEGATGLEKNTDKGRDNHKSLLDLAEAANKSAASTLNATGSQDAASAALQRGRDALINAATQYGMTAAEAQAYADKVLATPETITTTFNANTAAAEAVIARYKALMSDVGGVINTTLNVMTNLTGEKKASGGTVGHAYGGTIGLAQGGTIPGINGGVRNGTVYGLGTAKSDSVNVNLSRGEEVIQEPYASLNRPLLKAINRGDFMNGVAPAQSAVVVREIGDVYVQNPVTGKYLLAQMDARVEGAIDRFNDQQGQAGRWAR